MGSSPRHLFGALLIALGVSPATAQVKVLVTSVAYQSPFLVAPVVLLSSVSESGTPTWHLGVAGYTLSATRIMRHSSTLSTVIAADVTPLNSNSSNYVYRDGERDSTLAFRDATVEVNAGVQVSGGEQRSRWGLEVRAIALDESVSRLAAASVLARWRDPYVGLGIAASYSRVVSDETLAARWDGLKAGANVVGFAGARPWWKSQTWLGVGKRLGRVFLMGRAWALLGRNLDVVNQHLVGGSWDLDRSPALYGYHYAEFRVHQGAVLSAGVDLRLAGTWALGLRAGYLSSPSRSTYGEAIRLSTMARGIGFHVGVGLPRTHTALVFGGVSAAVF